MATMSVSQARAALPQLLSRVDAGEEVTITRHGRAVAVVVRPDALRIRRAARAFADAQRIHHLLTDPLDPGSDADPAPDIDPAWADDLVAEIRAARDGK